ncbi:DNA-binding response regulator [Methylococcaceae bacterium CS1]|nr:response regulator transcription factor [Methyloprofundus sp.]TXK95651.1 DNA-binding response regulator [Methylococcaceae bacterium CS4]TXK99606.1 DNA-binding response regulator [Methylococcaceae bacterium CS5]TXL03741.1 DNA-binding response regulator [Methylococcaceae bacterium CS1]TXL08163.1 DNA-binding response regulator [Methylococcaceae bacterium CS3]TXL09964.1 DNA-binding response regulator [Methylococcaceae bacterium CS2]
MNILLIEDDAVLSDGLTHILQKSGYTVSATASGNYALQLIHAQGFDLIVLDLGLPDMDGLEVLRNIRHQKIALPVLILTARDGVSDRIEGISQGADDYLTKPFDLGELEARIHALIRRCYGGFTHRIEVGRLVLDTQLHQILADGELLSLSAREAALLEILILQAGKVVSKDRIAQRLASTGEALADNAIEVYIHRLRKNLEPYQSVIRTIRGLGYLLKENSHGQ